MNDDEISEGNGMEFIVCAFAPVVLLVSAFALVAFTFVR